MTPLEWHRHIASAANYPEAQDRIEAALAAGIRPADLTAVQTEHYGDYPDPLRPRAIIRVQTGAHR